MGLSHVAAVLFLAVDIIANFARQNHTLFCVSLCVGVTQMYKSTIYLDFFNVYYTLILNIESNKEKQTVKNDSVRLYPTENYNKNIFIKTFALFLILFYFLFLERHTKNAEHRVVKVLPL